GTTTTWWSTAAAIGSRGRQTGRSVSSCQPTPATHPTDIPPPRWSCRISVVRPLGNPPTAVSLPHIVGTRRILRRAGWALIGCAGLVLAFLGYQLYVTDFLNDRVQAEAMATLEAELEARRTQLPAPEPVEVTVPEEVEEPEE